MFSQKWKRLFPWPLPRHKWTVYRGPRHRVAISVSPLAAQSSCVLIRWHSSDVVAACFTVIRIGTYLVSGVRFVSYIYVFQCDTQLGRRTVWNSIAGYLLAPKIRWPVSLITLEYIFKIFHIHTTTNFKFFGCKNFYLLNPFRYRSIFNISINNCSLCQNMFHFCQCTGHTVSSGGTSPSLSIHWRRLATWARALSAALQHLAKHIRYSIRPKMFCKYLSKCRKISHPVFDCM